MTEPSCVNCPSWTPAIAGSQVLGRNIGVPVCARFGKPLGRIGSSAIEQARMEEGIAKSCSSFRSPRPAPSIVDPVQVAFGLSPDGRLPDEAVSSCRSCSFFVQSESVLRSGQGWSTGLCRAKGELVLSSQERYKARDCDRRTFGTQSSLEDDPMLFFPEFQSGFNMPAVIDPVAEFLTRSQEDIVEPHEYPSDKEVSDEDWDTGIRAWRKITDPQQSSRFVHLPVYRTDFFEAAEAGKIPRTGDDEHPELYVDHFGGVYLAAVAWTELDETPAAWGEAGVGKTELARHLAWLMCLPFERISITGQTELDDLAGKMMYSAERGTYFQYGRLPRAWAKPCVMVLDEPNVGPPEVWQFIRPLTDNSKQMVLDMNEGERIKRHTDCFMMMAMNPSWDPKNVGAMPIGDADANRLFHVFIGLPPESLEVEIISKRVQLDGWSLTPAQIKMLMGVAKDIRALAEDDTVPISWGLRPQIKVARALRWFDPVTAYKRAVTDYLEPDAQRIMLDAVRSHAVSDLR